MSTSYSWPPLRWKSAALMFCVAAAIFLAVALNYWPEMIHSTPFRVVCLVAVIGFSLVVLRRPKPRT